MGGIKHRGRAVTFFCKMCIYTDLLRVFVCVCVFHFILFRVILPLQIYGSLYCGDHGLHCGDEFM